MNTKALARGALARLGIKPVPLAVGFEITHQCNLACGYCDRHTKLPNEMTCEQIFAALAELVELGMAHTSLDGGEPLTHPNIAEVVDFLLAREVQVYMNTNGKLIPRKLDVVRKLSKVKISMDGPREAHDAMRGTGAFDKAIAGARAAREVGVEVALTCVVGTHNADHIDELIDFVEAERLPIIFQPARPSLFLDGQNRDATWVLEADLLRQTLAHIARRRRDCKYIANGWASLRHFRAFPNDKKLPCAAGWINVTMDPEGNLYHCGQVSRLVRKHNVVRLGARRAFESLERRGCAQCWCARVVEENYAWGGRILQMLPPVRALEPAG
ncbi:MAG: radical SAM protein [Deltaproteobacteria bacterium]|nr:radical SAM protein [Deltaproteobacteria bacterium]